MNKESKTDSKTVSDIELFERGVLYYLKLKELKPMPKPIRRIENPAALAELAASIKELGVFQPIHFVVDSKGRKLVVTGNRRVKAARQAGLSTIPGILVGDNIPQISLSENLLRLNLTPIEEAEGLLALKTEQHYSQGQLAALLGKTQATVSEILSLNNLPQAVRDDLRGDCTISKSTLITIAKKKNEEEMSSAYAAYKEKHQPLAASPRSKNPHHPQSVLPVFTKAATKITALDTSAWTEEEKSNFQNTLTSLKTEIENYLANGSQPVPPA